MLAMQTQDTRPAGSADRFQRAWDAVNTAVDPARPIDQRRRLEDAWTERARAELAARHAAESLAEPREVVIAGIALSFGDVLGLATLCLLANLVLAGIVAFLGGLLWLAIR
jgi:hypothetical protein